MSESEVDPLLALVQRIASNVLGEKLGLREAISAASASVDKIVALKSVGYGLEAEALLKESYEAISDAVRVGMNDPKLKEKRAKIYAAHSLLNEYFTHSGDWDGMKRCLAKQFQILS